MSAILVINFHVKAQHLDTLLGILEGAKRYLPENGEGCSAVRVLQDVADPNRIKLMETWDSVAAHQAHFEAINASGDWQGIVAMMLTEPQREYYNDI
ncbi:MAG: antibiotic biosynthesis monooxygenase [Alphaproteobacteria bacterium]|nr:antibiotic biosynthesis monooxygenase [Alphaproteobacteria bacterium]